MLPCYGDIKYKDGAAVWKFEYFLCKNYLQSVFLATVYHTHKSLLALSSL